MLKLFRSLFVREIQPLRLSEDEIETWFLARAHEKMQSFDAPVQQFYRSLAEIKKQLENANLSLMQAHVKDEDKIEPRVKSIVLGHRESYYRSLATYIASINVPEGIDVSQCTLTRDILKQKLNEFAQSTQKSFGGVKHLFHENADEITSLLRDLDNYLDNFSRATTHIQPIESLKNKISELKKQKQMLLKIGQEKVLKKSRLDNTQIMLEKKQKEIEELCSSSAYLEYSKLKESSVTASQKFNETENSIIQLFASIERALKKYEHLTGDSIALEYITSPNEMLMKYDNLQILQLIQKVKVKLPELSLKDGEKVKESLDFFSEEKLDELKKSYAHLREQLEILDIKLNSSSVVSKLKDLEYKREHFQGQLDRLKKELEALDSNPDAVNRLKTEIIEDIKTIFRQPVVLV